MEAAAKLGAAGRKERYVTVTYKNATNSASRQRSAAFLTGACFAMASLAARSGQEDERVTDGKIIWVTSTTATVGKLRAQAKKIAAAEQRAGRKVAVVGVGLNSPPTSTQRGLAEKLLTHRFVRDGNVLVAFCPLEIPLLAMLKAVRLRKIGPEQLSIRVLHKDGKRDFVATIGVRGEGELDSCFPGGFFDERMALVF